MAKPVLVPRPELHYYLVQLLPLTGVDNGVDGVDGLGVVLHLVHVEAELWAAVVGDQTDTDSGLAQVGLQEEVVDKVLHLLEVLGTDGGRLIQDDEEVELVVGI